MIEPLYALRDVDVPVGARTRIRARIEAELDRPVRPRRRAAALAFATAAVVTMIIVAIALPQSTSRREVDVPAGTRVEVVLANGRSSVVGPAQVTLDDQGLSLSSGKVDAEGKLRVRGPSCDVMIDGSAEVSVKGPQLTVRVFAGSVEIVPPVVSCERIDLTPAVKTANHAPRVTDDVTKAPTAEPALVAPAVAIDEPVRAEKPITPAPTRPDRTPSLPALPDRPSAPPPPPPPTIEAVESAPPQPTDELTQALADYRAATALESNDPAGAVLAWQTWRTKHATSALAHGADLRLLALLRGLHRDREVAELAREFLQRYPKSPRRADVERLLEAPR